MLIDQSFNDFFLGVVEICSRWICGNDVIDDLDALSIIFALLYPTKACGNVFEPFSLKLFLCEYLLDHLED